MREQVELISVTPQKFVRYYVFGSDCRNLYKIMDSAVVSNAATRNQFNALKLDSDETRTQMAPCYLTTPPPVFWFLQINTR
jgi:hypothetical protein